MRDAMRLAIRGLLTLALAAWGFGFEASAQETGGDPEHAQAEESAEPAQAPDDTGLMDPNAVEEGEATDSPSQETTPGDTDLLAPEEGTPAEEATPESPPDPPETDPEADSSAVFAYHGLLIGDDDQVIEDPSEELLASFFGSPASEEDELVALADTQSRDPAGEALKKSNEYRKACSDAGVPIPPSLAGGGWKSLGVLPGSSLFVSSTSHTELLLHTKKNASGETLGICLALPRSVDAGGGKPGALQLLGVICQSKRTGSACFWDNIGLDQPPNGSDRLTGASYRDVDITKFRGGESLGENCTNCHRGDNAYVIHANTILARAPDLQTSQRKPDKRYSPIGQANWLNPEHPSPPCTSCHGFPVLTKPYCRSVILPSIGKTMPMPMDADDGANYTLDADWSTAFASDIKQIQRECDALK